jgi:hypothetical protein
LNYNCTLKRHYKLKKLRLKIKRLLKYNSKLLKLRLKTKRPLRYNLLLMSSKISQLLFQLLLQWLLSKQRRNNPSVDSQGNSNLVPVKKKRSLLLIKNLKVFPSKMQQ